MFPSPRQRTQLRAFALARFPEGTRLRRWMVASVGMLRSWGVLKYPGELDQFTFPKKRPVVSIVIPTFQNAGFTIRCLHAIRSHETRTSFEIIVIDDGSSQRHQRRLKRLTGIHLLLLKDNVGYLRACNSAFPAARGEFIALLNNDTLPQPGWLDAMMQNFTDPTVGLVGAKLVTPDGVLQEAGGLIYRNGTVSNYGSGEQPDDPRFNYRREVDYCSAAAVVVRSHVLASLGGYDTRYKNAYYEDTDLAMSTRSLGYKVIYDPGATVAHIGHGTYRKHAPSSPEELMATNRKFFEAKWKRELRAFPPNTLDSLELDARRHVGKSGTIVVIDQFPRWNHDSGSLRLLEIIRGYQNLGYAIVLVSPRYFDEPEYKTELARMGVQHRFANEPTLVSYLVSISSTIKFFHAARPSGMEYFLAEIAPQFPDVRVVFDTVDLHFLREAREHELTTRPKTQRLEFEMAQRRQAELKMVKLADLTLVVSPIELEILTDLGHGARVALLSNAHRAPLTVARDSASREGLVFVGNFHHLPNEDGLKWFLDEVYPLITESLGNVPLDIVGSPRPKHLERRSFPAVKTLGWVDDLTSVYAKARVAIAPIRWGAGVKGKVGEAWAHSLPVVLTTIAAEGMHIEHPTSGLIEDDAQGFAAAVVQLLTNDAQWEKMSTTCRAHVETHFGVDAFSRSLLEIVKRLNT